MLERPGKKRFSWLVVWYTVLAAVLAGCGNNPNYAPEVERSERPKQQRGDHVVHSGETLYAIAWRYGMDFRRLAAANNLRAPYVIYPGQRLRLQEATPAQASSSRTVASSSGRASSGGRTDQQAASRKKEAARSTSPAPAPSKTSRLGPWRWPAKGAVIRGFAATSAVHKGIDLKGELGEPVMAANGGQVVYAGSGLVGYGNLVIIKHDNQFLSAYGHNRRILVREGQSVKAGEKIAEIGDTGTNTTMLHFEIRRNGQPVDPLGLLPRR